MYLVNRHVVPSLVLYGIVVPDIITCIEENKLEVEEDELENRKFPDETHGAEESVWYLRRRVRAILGGWGADSACSPRPGCARAGTSVPLTRREQVRLDPTPLAKEQDLSWKLDDGTLR